MSEHGQPAAIAMAETYETLTSELKSLRERYPGVVRALAQVRVKLAQVDAKMSQMGKARKDMAIAKRDLAAAEEERSLKEQVSVCMDGWIDVGIGRARVGGEGRGGGGGGMR